MSRLTAISGFLLVISLTFGCAAQIVPRPLSSADRINPADRSITIQHPGLTVSARVQDSAVGGYSLSTSIASFYLVIQNRGQHPVVFQPEAFTLVDGSGQRHSAVAPDQVNLLLQPEYDYLVPFPFVSYLDVAVVEKQRAATALASEEPYVGGGLAANITGDPLPATPIASGGSSSGVVFFAIDLEAQTSFRLQVADPSGSPPFVFPFTVEK